MSHQEEDRPSESGSDTTWTVAQREAIQSEADRILADPVFKNSKRCVALFRRLIEYGLDGDQEGVKERTLAIEVFGRSSDYDTNTDPIIRMTANEIRKRLAQYYQASTTSHVLKIRMVPGTYLPRFEFDTPIQQLAAVETETPEAVSSLMPFPGPVVPLRGEVPEMERPRRSHKWALWALAGALAVVGTVVLILTGSRSFRSTQYLFWEPVLESNEPVTVCVGDLSALFKAGGTDWAQTAARIIAEKNLPTMDPMTLGPPQIPFVDADVAARLTGWLSAHQQESRVRLDSTLTLEDLRRGPAIIIGALNNHWWIALLSNLRYHFRVDPASEEIWIEDAQNPSRRDWKVIGKTDFNYSLADYAIVTRVLDKDTGKWVLSVAGMGLHGTEAAGELLTDPKLNSILPPVLRSGRKNIQMVIVSRVIEGHTGLPQIVSVYTW